MNLSHHMVYMHDLAEIARGESRRTYPVGTIYVKLSAVDEFVGILRKPGTIEGRYAAMVPHPDLNADYLFLIVQRSFPEFLRRYRTTINLQEATLRKYFTVDYHDDRATQAWMVQTFSRLDDEIERIQNQIAEEKEIKRWYLGNMFV